MRYFELINNKSAKFWEIIDYWNEDRKNVQVRYGKIGTEGRTIRHYYHGPAKNGAGTKMVDKLVAQKLKKGYVERKFRVRKVVYKKKTKKRSKKTKRKKTRKRKKTHKQRGGMYPSNNIYFPPNGYTEPGKDQDYERISNAVTSSIVNEHFTDLLEIFSTFAGKHVHFTDLSNIGGQINDKQNPGDSGRQSVEPGPTGYDLVKHVIRPEVTSGFTNTDNVFINVSKTNLTPQEQGNVQGKKTFSSEITIQTRNIPGMPGGATQKYRYEIIVYTQTPSVKTVCIKINEIIGGASNPVTEHGADDLLLWVLFKIAIAFTNVLGATIITTDNMRFIQSGNEFDKMLYRHFDSLIRKKIELDSKFNLVIPA